MEEEEEENKKEEKNEEEEEEGDVGKVVAARGKWSRLIGI